MSRPKRQRAIRVIDNENPELTALRAELEDRLDQLRAVIEAKRRVGWTVVRSPVADTAAHMIVVNPPRLR